MLLTACLIPRTFQQGHRASPLAARRLQLYYANKHKKKQKSDDYRHQSLLSQV